MKKNMLIVLAAVVVVAAATAAYFISKNGSDTTINVTQPVRNNAQSAQNSNTTHPKVKPASTCITKVEQEILYCDSGFSDYLNVILGEKVTVKNSSAKVLDFETYASAPENSMTYKVNPNMNLGKINPGESKSFIAKPLGEFKYRDNNIPSHTGILGIEDDL